MGAVVRSSAEGDMDAVQRIYAREVLHGLASFEEVPPVVSEMVARREAVLGLGLPYLVAELDAEVVGFAYAGLYRTRPAYRYTVETSVYVANGMRGVGVGKLLLAAVIEACEQGPWRQMIAVIGNSGNAGSIGLHVSLGFEEVGTLRSVGFKHGGWVDTVLMQRPLNGGDADLPDVPG